MRGLRSRRAIVLGLSVLTLAGCTSGGGSAPATPSSAGPAASTSGPVGGTATNGLAGGGETSVAPRSTILTTPTPTLSVGAAGSEIDRPCPYISNSDWALAEGNRVGRSVELAGSPVGCRFYFQYDDSVITGEITVERFKTPTEAFNAVVSAAKLDPGFVDDKTIGDHGSISVRLPLQGAKTWACIFSVGVDAVTVHTSQDDTSQNGRNLAREIAPKVR